MIDLISKNLEIIWMSKDYSKNYKLTQNTSSNRSDLCLFCCFAWRRHLIEWIDFHLELQQEFYNEIFWDLSFGKWQESNRINRNLVSRLSKNIRLSATIKISVASFGFLCYGNDFIWMMTRHMEQKMVRNWKTPRLSFQKLLYLLIQKELDRSNISEDTLYNVLKIHMNVKGKELVNFIFSWN